MNKQDRLQEWECLLKKHSGIMKIAILGCVLFLVSTISIVIEFISKFLKWPQSINAILDDCFLLLLFCAIGLMIFWLWEERSNKILKKIIVFLSFEIPMATLGTICVFKPVYKQECKIMAAVLLVLFLYYIDRFRWNKRKYEVKNESL